MNMRILVVARNLPYPVLDGYQLVTWNMVKELSSHCEFDLLASSDGRDGEGIDRVRKAFRRVELVDGRGSVPGGQWPAVGRLWSILRARLSRLPSDVLRTRSFGMSEMLVRMLAKYSYDAVYLSAPALAFYAPDLSSRIPTIVAPLDARSRQIPELSRVHRGILRRVQCWEQTAKSRWFERRFYGCAVRCIVVSEADRRALLQLGLKIPIDVVPLGVDVDRWERIEPSAQRGAHSYDLAFSGNLSYDPNLEGAQSLVTDLLPLVRRNRPGTTLAVIGAHPPESLRRQVFGDPGTILTGYVPDLAEEIARAKVFVCPVRYGSGMRVKVMEAMAAGLPVVTYPLNVEELPAVHDEHVLVARSPEEFVRHTTRLLNDAGTRVRLGTSARRLILQSFSWRSSASRMMESFRRSCGVRSSDCRLRTKELPCAG